jgi:hypothetical protein
LGLKSAIGIALIKEDLVETAGVKGLFSIILAG